MAKLSNINDSQKFIVSQANNLVEANYPPELTARAHKTARLILSLISPDDKSIHKYTVKTDGLKKYLGIKANTRWGSFYAELKSIAKTLREKEVEIKTPEGDYINASFLSAFKLSPKEGTVTFEVSGLLKPYLLELKKNYTSYLLAYIPKLKSTYSIRLYELLHQYRKFGKREFEVQNLQKKVGSQYSLYGDFKKRVILQAQKDLKKYTDLNFIFNEIKSGRKVTSIQFIIFGNTPEDKRTNQLSFLDDSIEVIDKPEAPAFSESIVKELNRIGISEQNIAKYLSLGFGIINDEEKRVGALERCGTIAKYYLEKLELLKISPTGQKRENAAGFFIKALKEDWHSTKAFQKVTATIKENEKNKAQKKIKALERKLEKLLKERKEIVEPIYNNLIADKDIAQKAYDISLESVGNFYKANYRELLSKSILEQYNQNRFLQASMNGEFYKMFSDKFKKSKPIEEAVNNTKVEIDKLKKEFHL